VARQIFITEKDRERLQKLINEAKEFHSGSEIYLKNLEQELSRAKLIASEKIPHNVVTMN